MTKDLTPEQADVQILTRMNDRNPMERVPDRNGEPVGVGSPNTKNHTQESRRTSLEGTRAVVGDEHQSQRAPAQLS